MTSNYKTSDYERSYEEHGNDFDQEGEHPEQKQNSRNEQLKNKPWSEGCSHSKKQIERRRKRISRISKRSDSMHWGSSNFHFSLFGRDSARKQRSKIERIYGIKAKQKTPSIEEEHEI